MAQMKKLIFILISFLLTGCPEGIERSDRYYILENNSNHEIVIKFYHEGILLDYLTTVLSEDEKHRGSIRYQNTSDSFFFPSNAFKSDSIVVDFDNLKRTTYAIDFINQSYSEPIDRNIFNHENYEHKGNDRFLFSITEEDYNRAEDMN